MRLLRRLRLLEKQELRGRSLLREEQLFLLELGFPELLVEFLLSRFEFFEISRVLLLRSYETNVALLQRFDFSLMFFDLPLVSIGLL